MPHTDVIPTSASVASVGNFLRYIGDRVYGYSGIIGVGASGSGGEDLLFEAHSGSGVIEAKLQIFYFSVSTNNFFYKIYLNDTVAYAYATVNLRPSFGLGAWTNILIPPNTKLKVTASNQESSVDRNHTFGLVGRVYGAE